MELRHQAHKAPYNLNRLSLFVIRFLILFFYDDYHKPEKLILNDSEAILIWRDRIVQLNAPIEEDRAGVRGCGVAVDRRMS